MIKDNSQEVFLALVRAGLWEQEVQLLSYGKVDYRDVMRLAEEQSVVGLVTAGLEHVSDVEVPQMELLSFIGATLQIEESNKDMNCFVGELMKELREAEITALLLKGQGIAQCYERSLWRTNGDVDLLLDEQNYQKAKEVLGQRVSHENREGLYNLHQAMTIDGWEVELHGTMRTDLGRRIDNELDSVHSACFRNKEFRLWENAGEAVPLPSPDDDVVFVFTHILQHFFKGGIGLRQICDWCRLLWTYREQLDLRLLESRLKQMGLITEWMAFGTFAIEWLRMPEESMPLVGAKIQDTRFKRKSLRIMRLVMETGNFGHNRDASYHEKYPFLVYKAISLWQTTKDSLRHFLIFPKDAVRIWWKMLVSGMGRAAKGIT